MKDYEKLGSFYLGKEYDLAEGERRDELVLYDSKDLTTHAVIVGMTGSGKTGLGIGLLEEALIDNIPVIAVDPKGDLPNLLLSFPQLRPKDFRPWINEQDASQAGMTGDEFAESQAELWKNGLKEWGQSAARIRKLRESVAFSVYTPGSSAGRQLSLLRSLDPPPGDLQSDPDLWREAVGSTTTGILTLLGLKPDPLTSREHILIANLIERSWAEGKSLDLAGLIRGIQKPRFERLGVLDLESFFPSTERFQLAMRLNNLLASPGFEAWLEGEPLNIDSLLVGPGGQPKASVISIAHLPDAERMFFMTMLLNRIVAWMRKQPGTTSLRAILYIDEVLGLLPPVANPPSKAPLLALLKQARAYGLGIVLATQNPVDLDYKGLSNAGTWFLGRLQTERDKERLLDGLEGAGGGGFDRASVDRTISSLDKRVFLLHNVHENEPVVFETRWVMSYLRGPMTREEIRRLGSDEESTSEGNLRTLGAKSIPTYDPSSTAEMPVLPPEIASWYLPASGAGKGLVYRPGLLGLVEVHYSSRTHDVEESRKVGLLCAIEDGADAIDWAGAEEIDIGASDLEGEPLPGTTFGTLPGLAHDKRSFARWKKDLARWVRREKPLVLFSSPTFDMSSEPGESEAQFRARLGVAARERRDLEVARLRKRLESRFQTLEGQLQRAEQAIAREAEQARHKKVDTAISFGTALLGAFLGRKRFSTTTASRAGTAMSKASRMRKEQQDVEHAKEEASSLRSQLDELELQLEREAAELESTFDPTREVLKEVSVRAKASDVEVTVFGIAWCPFRKASDGRTIPDW